MRRVVVSEFVSLDGVVEDPRWTFRFMSKEREDYKFDELSASGALLLGRATYEGFAAAWPSMMERYEGPRRAELQTYTDMMNGYPKYVVSTTLQEPLEWNNSTLVEGDAAEEVLRLKQQPGKDILVFGSGRLVNTLLRHDLIDDYRLMVFPIIVSGSRQRLFEGESGPKVLGLVETKTLGSDVVVLTYQPAAEEAEG
jgi:dihydrofolate reductase